MGGSRALQHHRGEASPSQRPCNSETPNSFRFEASIHPYVAFSGLSPAVLLFRPLSAIVICLLPPALEPLSGFVGFYIF